MSISAFPLRPLHPSQHWNISPRAQHDSACDAHGTPLAPRFAAKTVHPPQRKSFSAHAFAIVPIMVFKKEKTGIVLINTGSPDSPEPQDIRPYLIEFLSDRNIIKVPPAIWQPILRLFIARTRPKKTAPRYQQIWTANGAPLTVESCAQRDALNERLAEAGIDALCEVGMRYGNPSITHALQKLEAAGCNKIVALPLFPQTAFSTVKTCKEAIRDQIGKHPNLSLGAIVEGYSDNPLYAQAIAASIGDAWEYRPGSKLLLSFHSIPLADIEVGDTYVEQIKTSTHQAMELLGIPRSDWAIAYHSRFEDSRAWVSPHPRTQLAQWAAEGVSRIALVTPGFASDCLESLYDIKSVAHDYFCGLCDQNGVTSDVTYIPCLNHREDHINLLFDVVKRATNSI